MNCNTIVVKCGAVIMNCNTVFVHAMNCNKPVVNCNKLSSRELVKSSLVFFLLKHEGEIIFYFF